MSLCNRQRPLRKPKATEMQSCESQSQWMYLQNTPKFKTQGTIQKKGQKNCKSQRIRYFTVK